MSGLLSSSNFDINEQKIKNFRLFDDVFFRTIIKESPKTMELILKLIMDNPELQVIELTPQKDIINFHGRSSVFDVLAIDSNGNYYDFEVERTDSKASDKHLRFHRALFDSYVLKPGEDEKDMPDSNVVYVTENDVFKKGKPLYFIELCLRTNNGYEPNKDGNQIIVVNGAYNSDDNLGKLMHDFKEINSDEMYFSEIAEIVRYFKENQKG